MQCIVSPLSFANQTDHQERPKGDICPFPVSSGRIFKPVRVYNGAKAFWNFHDLVWILNQSKKLNFNLKSSNENAVQGTRLQDQWQIMAFLPISASRLASSNTLFEFENHKVANMYVILWTETYWFKIAKFMITNVACITCLLLRI